MFRKLLLLLVFSLPLHSHQSPSPLGERTLSSPNGSPLREVFTDAGDANIYICDCSTWSQDESGIISELNVRLELKSDYMYGSYIFQNIPLKTTLSDLQNVLLEEQPNRSLCFLYNDMVLRFTDPLKSYPITPGDLIFVVDFQQYVAVKDDPEKLEGMLDKLHTNWKRNAARIDSARKMIKRQEGLDMEVAKLMDLRLKQRELRPTACRRYFYVLPKEKERKVAIRCILNFPNETPPTDSNLGHPSTKPLPDAWDSK